MVGLLVVLFVPLLLSFLAMPGLCHFLRVTPEFLVHLTFNHCGDSVMKLMGRHPELYNLSLCTHNGIVGQAKNCLGCMIANMRLGAQAMYNHSLTNPAMAAGESHYADIAGPIRPLGIGQAKYILAVVDGCSRYPHISFRCAERVSQPHCLHSCSNVCVHIYSTTRGCSGQRGRPHSCTRARGHLLTRTHTIYIYIYEYEYEYEYI